MKVDTQGRPQFARRSHVFWREGKGCRHTSGLQTRERFGPDGMRWLAPLQVFELEALYPRKVRPAPVLPVLPSTIDCQSNLWKKLLVCQ